MFRKNFDLCIRRNENSFDIVENTCMFVAPEIKPVKMTSAIILGFSRAGEFSADDPVSVARAREIRPDVSQDPRIPQVKEARAVVYKQRLVRCVHGTLPSIILGCGNSLFLSVYGISCQ